MISPDPVRLRDATIFRTEPPRGRPAQRMRRRIALLIVAAALASRAIPLAFAQGNPPAVTPPPASAATSPTVDCLPVRQDLVMPPEIDASDGVLKGIISMAQEFQRLPPSAPGENCAQQLVRVYRRELPKPPSNELLTPVPGPTLRARVGDLVQLTFVNAVDANRFDKNVVLGPNGCMQVGKGGSLYPQAFDRFPDCLHASSTANIHYHGTHTNPDATGDNVFLEILPLPRDIPGNLTTTPTEAMVGLEQFFRHCAAQLKDHPLNQWPRRWSDMPNDWIWLQRQKYLLQAYQDKHSDQEIWEEDKGQDAKGGWPQYYIGVVPYCFVLPYKSVDEPVDKGVLRMGQAPGTHWYHAHKHGSTAIDVMEGMTGAFIIEGQYDDDLNAFYASYGVKRGGEVKPWNTRLQPVLVLNQLSTTPNLLSAVQGMGPPTASSAPFAINGLVAPNVHMQPGEIQLWRIVNSSSRSAAYFMAPESVAPGCPERLQWRQLAQDGVQFAQPTYASPQNQNRPFYMAPANRVDLLVQAPMLQPPLTKATCNVLIQAVMGRSEVKPTPVNPNKDNDPAPGTALMSVEVSGDPVTQNGQPVQEPMPFPPEDKAPKQPKFLADITDQELAGSNYISRKFIFDSKSPQSAKQHTINDVQFQDSLGRANVEVALHAVEEWTIENTTNKPGGPIDHPFHIHINPYQITEVFDPNENLTDLQTGELLTNLVNGKTQPVPRYVTDESQKSKTPEIAKRQCVLDPKNESTWSVAGACGPQPPQSNVIWWDTFAIPSGRVEQQKVIPGYFKMRSRFVDYHGAYVMHCHILIHEDRGMMFTVNVIPAPELMVHHH